MKILLVSDTHGKNELLPSLVKQYPNMDYYLHLGDSQSDPYSLYPFDSVKGNCDYYPFDEVRSIMTPYGYLYAKHKPFTSYKELLGVKIAVYGHTHSVHVEKNQDIVYICPGSLTLPRDGSEGTYIILDISSEKVCVSVYEVTSKNILTYYEIM